MSEEIKQKVDSNNEQEQGQDSDKEVDNRNQLFQSLRDFSIQWAPAMRMTILLSISIVAILVRVFSVIRYESIIHEFDPWFNYRTTQFLVQNQEGMYGLWNWFDSESWYPLGRSVGGTVYPGLMSTAGGIYWFLHWLSIPVDIRNVCVFLAPVFAALTALASYLMTTEITKRNEAGLFAALFISIVPSYMSRSVAGSYDNEGVSIFALVITFYLWLKASNTGSILWSLIASLSLFYMVASWGGYAFIINLIPIYVVFLLVSEKFNIRVYVAYNVFYVCGTLLSMQIPFVGFQAIHSSEHMASHGVFFLLQIYMFVGFIKQYISKRGFQVLSRIFLVGSVLVLILGFMLLFLTGQSKWSGRSMTLLDPTYAKKYIPIIASVSEHQATTWSSFFFDLHFLMLFTPIGLYKCFQNPNPGRIFIGLYVVLAVYFASVMVRLLLVLAPAVCIMSGIGLSWILRKLSKAVRSFFIKGKQKNNVPIEVAIIGILLVCYLCSTYVLHANFSGAEAYSSPSIILSSRDQMGNRHLIDDFRESYYWLRMNTKPDDKILSWWDYGYQITGMSNRTVMVDNNTWNNTHIATVGLAMASSEEDAFQICDRLDVDFVLIIFGGYSYYSGDDINKFLWMVRIAGGVYPRVKEEDYYGKGNYRVDTGASETMSNSLMYRLSYYRFDEVQTAYSKPKGYDNVRNTQIGVKGYKLENFEEAYTSENWIVRIFRRKPRHNRESLKFVNMKLANFPNDYADVLKTLDVVNQKQFKNKIQTRRKKRVN